MNVQERLSEISKLSGFSEEIVDKVLKAEATSIAGSIRKGERATLIGRCTILPSLGAQLVSPKELKHYIKVKINITKSLLDRVADLSDFEEPDEIDLMKLPGMVTDQITDLL